MLQDASAQPGLGIEIERSELSIRSDSLALHTALNILKNAKDDCSLNGLENQTNSQGDQCHPTGARANRAPKSTTSNQPISIWCTGISGWNSAGLVAALKIKTIPAEKEDRAENLKSDNYERYNLEPKTKPGKRSNQNNITTPDLFFNQNETHEIMRTGAIVKQSLL